MDNRGFRELREHLSPMPTADTHNVQPAVLQRAVLAGHWILAALYLAIALAAMWLAPRVPYADGWRFLGHFVSAPALQAILRPDNGHHEILPNAVRVLELRAFDAQQWLQVWIGIGLLLATLAVVRAVLRTQDAPARRATTMLAAVLGFCWLGNVRTLAHANESVHAYLVTLCVALGIALLARGDERPGARAGWGATLLGMIAAFSFSSGLAAFVAFLAVAWLRRARLSAYAALGLTFVATLVLRRWGNTGVDAAMLQFAPATQLELLLRWLAGPSVYAIWPVTDPVLAAHVPTAPLRALAQWVANAWNDAFGPVMHARWPHLLVGAASTAWLAMASWRARRGASPAVLLGIGLAWFGFAVGGLIAIARLHYFALHSDQLLAPRYVVWSNLFWTGLAITAIARVRRPRVAAVAMLVVAIGLLPSQIWMWRLGESMRNVAQRTAVAAAVGMLDPALETGETVPQELAAALPAAQAAGVAVFAWPETALLGRRADTAAVHSVSVARMTIEPVGNALDKSGLGQPGRRVRFAAQSDAARLVLVDADGIARGIAIRDPEEGGWLGWMRGAEGGSVRAVALR